MQIIDPDGVPVNDAANYPLDAEGAIAWCVANDANVDFQARPGPRTSVRVSSYGYVAVRPTFIEAVKEMQRKQGQS